MKTHLINSIAKATLLSAMIILTSVASAQAQSLADRPRFNIPFNFVFGERQLQAGKYSFGRALPTSGDVMVTIADREGESKAVVLSHAASKSRISSKAMLVFHRYGDQNFLVQVWPANSAFGREFPKTKLEREAQKGQQLSVVRVLIDR